MSAPAPDVAVLQIVGLTKRFGTNTVLRGIDLDVGRGERIAILGASGSGKSTLLRCVNFMETPTAGCIRLDGVAIGKAGTSEIDRRYSERELTAVRRRVGMVFQQFNLFPHMTVIGNVMEGLRTVLNQPAAQARFTPGQRARH